MRVLVFNRFYLPGYKGGGPIKTLKNLFDEAQGQIKFKVITLDRDLGDELPYEGVTGGNWYLQGSCSVLHVRPGFHAYFRIIKELISSSYDLVYVNSFFSPCFSFFPLVTARILGQSVVVGPRGEFSEGALSLKTFKKKIFIYIFKLLKIHRKTVFQASSDFEARDIRNALGHDVDILVAEDIAAREFAERVTPRRSAALQGVFVSRISPKKNLIRALEILGNCRSPIKYDIYGPIEDSNYWGRCKKVIDGLPEHIEVVHKGELKPQEVVSVMSGYDFFLFPTKGENYGHVIAEALCAGLPIIIADTTPWRNLQSQGIGWEIPLSDSDKFSRVLDELAEMRAEEYLEMRSAIVAWAKRKFSQRGAIEANIALFKYAYENKLG
ncbi:glycosyltransferase [Marinobacter nauticus]